MTDPGLMVSLLNWQSNELMLNPDRSGKLMETFVFHELASQIDCAMGEYELFHYRDREKREIDFLIERNDGALLGIEVKAGTGISRSDFKPMKWFKDSLNGKREFTGVLLYAGDFASSFGDDLWVVPMSSLWLD